MIWFILLFIAAYVTWRVVSERQVAHHLSLVERSIRHPNLWNNTGNYDKDRECIVTASFNLQLARLDPDDRVHSKALRRVRRIIGGDIINWNDAPTTTHQMVMDALKKARELPWWWASAPKLAGVPTHG